MKQIPLTQGKFAIIDDADYEEINKHKWFANKHGYTYYAARKVRLPNGKQTTIKMHRIILGLEFGDPRQSDHRNHNTLNNQRENLRIVTNKQNQQNRKPRKHYSSIFKGVSLCKSTQKWQAKIKVNCKTIHLGYFDSEIEAAHIYDKAASEYFGEFAYLNRKP